MLDLQKLLAGERGHLAALAEAHINPAFVKCLKLLGFDKHYNRAQGAYLYDDAGNRYLDCLVGYGTFACGRNHPGGIAVAAFVWASIEQASGGLLNERIPTEISKILQGTLLISAVVSFEIVRRRNLTKSIKQAAAQSHATLSPAGATS